MPKETVNRQDRKPMKLDFSKLSKNESTDVFKELLSDMGIGPEWKWEDAFRVIQHDPRVKAFRTMAEKKAVF